MNASHEGRRARGRSHDAALLAFAFTLAAQALACGARSTSASAPAAAHDVVVVEAARPAPAPVVTAPEPMRERAPSPPLTSAPAARPDGLVVEDILVGSGAEARAGDKLRVHYVGRLLDGQEFDSTHKRGVPFDFVLGKHTVIKGWEEGILGMRVGGSRRLVIPPEMAYGDSGRVGAIPPHSTLVFEVELLDILP